VKQIVIDAGPLIALFHAKDTDHQICVIGFTQLIQNRTQIIAPVPIVYEVYKWLLQKTSSAIAQKTLRDMEESLYFVLLDQDTLQAVQTMVVNLPEWKGSLEDATVAVMALRYRCPVWTLNYRDFSLFQSLEFWNPNST
jgi:predicted nucleic acid-binding protein